jgi:hypothetical protein
MKFYEEPVVEIEKFLGFDDLMEGWTLSSDDNPPVSDPFTN